MFHSSSAFGVVASSSPQIVVIDQGRTSTIKVNDIDDYFSCGQSLQTYSDQPLDLSIRKENKHERNENNGLSSKETAIIGCNSDQNQESVSNTKNTTVHVDTAADQWDIRITNVRSLATNHLANYRTDRPTSLQYETSRKESERIFGSGIKQIKRGIFKSDDDHLDLNNVHKKAQKGSYSLTISASPTSIDGLRQIMPRPASYLDQTPRNDKKLSGNIKDPSTLALDRNYPIPVKLFRSSEQNISATRNDKSEGKCETQTNMVQGPYPKQRNPVFILPSSNLRNNQLISGSLNRSSLESVNRPQLQIPCSLESGFHTHALPQNSVPNFSPRNVTDVTPPSPTLPASYIPKRLRKDPNRMKSTCPCNTLKSSTDKNRRNTPLSDEPLANLEVVKIHRRPYFQSKDSRELVEVRPRGLTDDGPTLLAYRELSGHIMVDWTARSNYRAAEKIKELTRSSLMRTSTSDQDQELNPAHRASSTITAQSPGDVTSLLANGVVYTISDE